MQQQQYLHQIYVLHSMFEYRHWEAEPIIAWQQLFKPLDSALSLPDGILPHLTYGLNKHYRLVEILIQSHNTLEGSLPSGILTIYSHRSLDYIQPPPEEGLTFWKYFLD